IGRAPSCDVIIDEPVASRVHCRIEFRDTFVLTDSSSHGSYLDDKRVVSQPLSPSCVLRVGGVLFRITVRGEICTLERADAALALSGVALASRGGGALVNHPLSAAHSSVEFADKASHATVCASCHTAGANISAERCTGCHTGFAARAAHHDENCGDCHREHE